MLRHVLDRLATFSDVDEAAILPLAKDFLLTHTSNGYVSTDLISARACRTFRICEVWDPENLGSTVPGI